MDVKVLTWNIQKKAKGNPTLVTALHKIIEDHKPNFLIFQEYHENYLDDCLKEYVGLDFDYVSGIGITQAVRVFASQNFIKHTKRYSVGHHNKIVCWEFMNVNFFAVHMYSKTWVEREQDNFNRDLLKKVDEFEQLTGHKNTLIVGDFNYNPFDASMIDPFMFSAVSSRKLVTDLKERKVGSNVKRLFYNPMWNKLGDYDVKRGEVFPGTYFRNKANSEEFHWNCLDGVLLSEGLVYKIDLDTLEIITESLSFDRLKDRTSYNLEWMSDHFPVVFTLNL